MRLQLRTEARELQTNEFVNCRDAKHVIVKRLVMPRAEAWRDNAGKRGKMFGRLEKAFLRENLVRRVSPRSLQFSAPTS